MRSFTETPNLGLGSLGLPVEITCSLCWVAFFDALSPANVIVFHAWKWRSHRPGHFRSIHFGWMGAEDFSGELVSGVSVAGDQIAGAGCQTKIAGKGMFTPVQIGPKDPEGTIIFFWFWITSTSLKTLTKIEDNWTLGHYILYMKSYRV